MANYVPRLKEKYLKEIRTGLKEKFSYKNDMMIPKLQKIVLNMGVGEAVGDSKKIKSAHADLRIISGQQPLITKAKKSIFSRFWKNKEYSKQKIENTERTPACSEKK